MSEALFIPSEASIAKALISLRASGAALNLDLSSYTPPIRTEAAPSSEEKQGLSSSESVPVDTPAKPIPIEQETPTAKTLIFNTPNGCSWADMMDSDNEFSDTEFEAPAKTSASAPVPTPSAQEPSSTSKNSESAEKLFKASQVSTPSERVSKSSISEAPKNIRRSPEPFRPSVRSRANRESVVPLEASGSSQSQSEVNRRISSTFSFADALKQNLPQSSPKIVPVEVKPTMTAQTVEKNHVEEVKMENKTGNTTPARPISVQVLAEKLDLTPDEATIPKPEIQKVGWSWAELVKGHQSMTPNSLKKVESITPETVATPPLPSLPKAEPVEGSPNPVQPRKSSATKAAHVRFEPKADAPSSTTEPIKESKETEVVLPVESKEDRAGWTWADRAKGQRMIKATPPTTADKTLPVLKQEAPSVVQSEIGEATIEMTPEKFDLTATAVIETPKICEPPATVPEPLMEKLELAQEAPRQVLVPRPKQPIKAEAKKATNKVQSKQKKTPSKKESTVVLVGGTQTVFWKWAPWARQPSSSTQSAHSTQQVVETTITSEIFVDETHENGSISTSEATLPSDDHVDETAKSEDAEEILEAPVVTMMETSSSQQQPTQAVHPSLPAPRSWAERTKEILPTTRKPLRGIVQRASVNTPAFKETDKTLPTSETLWIGGLGVRHDMAWLKVHFASHKIIRVVTREEGYAICEFPTGMVSKVIADFNNVKVDRKKNRGKALHSFLMCTIDFF